MAITVTGIEYNTISIDMEDSAITVTDPSGGVGLVMVFLFTKNGGSTVLPDGFTTILSSNIEEGNMICGWELNVKSSLTCTWSVTSAASVIAMSLSGVHPDCIYFTNYQEINDIASILSCDILQPDKKFVIQFAGLIMDTSNSDFSSISDQDTNDWTSSAVCGVKSPIIKIGYSNITTTSTSINGVVEVTNTDTIEHMIFSLNGLPDVVAPNLTLNFSGGRFSRISGQ